MGKDQIGGLTDASVTNISSLPVPDGCHLFRRAPCCRVFHRASSGGHLTAIRSGSTTRVPTVVGALGKATRRYVAPARGHFVIIGALSAVSLVGTLAAPALIRHPLALVVLSPRMAFLAVASTKLDLALFLLVGLVRLSVTDPVYFSLGRRSGALAFEDLDARAPHRWWARQLCWLKDRSSGVLAVALLVRPNARHIGLAGAQGMHGGWAIALSTAGTLAYLLMIRFGCDLLAG